MAAKSLILDRAVFPTAIAALQSVYERLYHQDTLADAARRYDESAALTEKMADVSKQIVESPPTSLADLVVIQAHAVMIAEILHETGMDDPIMAQMLHIAADNAILFLSKHVDMAVEADSSLGNTLLNAMKRAGGQA